MNKKESTAEPTQHPKGKVAIVGGKAKPAETDAPSEKTGHAHSAPPPTHAYTNKAKRK